MALNKQEKQLAVKLYTEGKKWREIYSAFPHKDPEEVRGYIRTTRVYKERHSHQSVETEIPQQISAGEFLDELVKFQEKVKQFDGHYDEINLQPFDKPYITIINWGDWHLGAKECDYKKFREDFEIIKNTPNLYVVMNGDMIDNSIENTHKGTRFEQIITPKIAKELVKQFTEDLKGKWLAIVSGDHDSWSFITDDFQPAEYFARHGKAPYFHWGGILNLKVLNIPYKIVVRHRYYGISRKNTANSHENLWRDTDADIVMLAHTHRNMASQEIVPEKGRLKVFLNSGSYKIWDNYHHKHGFKNSVAKFPAVVLSGYEKKAWVFPDFRDAVEFTESVLG